MIEKLLADYLRSPEEKRAATVAALAERPEAALEALLNFKGPYPAGHAVVDVYPDLIVPLMAALLAARPELLEKPRPRLTSPRRETLAQAALWAARGLVQEAWRDTKLWSTHYERAKRIVGAALKKRPDDPALLTGHGALLSDLGEHAKAAATLQKALDLGADDANAVYNLAVAVANLGSDAKARKLFAQAGKLRARPETWQAYFDPQGR